MTYEERRLEHLKAEFRANLQRDIMVEIEGRINDAVEVFFTTPILTHNTFRLEFDNINVSLSPFTANEVQELLMEIEGQKSSDLHNQHRTS